MEKIKVENLIFLLSVFIASIPFSSIALYVSTHVRVVFLIFILASVFFHFKNTLLPTWLINILSVILMLQALIGMSAEDILTPSLEALTLILSVRFIGKKTPREYFQIYLLSVLLLGASSIFNISWIFLIRVLIFLFTAIFSILLLAYVKETEQKIINRQVFYNLFKLSVVISLLSIPLSALFFIILPRAPSPLFDIGFTKAKTGFSSTVSLGSVATVEEDKTIVMRVSMKKIEDKDLYWRVITFDNFDGKQWSRTVKDGNPKISGQRISYTVSLESLTENYLPVLDYPVTTYLPNATYEYPAVFRVNFAPEKSIKYYAISFLNPNIEESITSQEYLKLPKSISKRVINLTEEITKEATSSEQIIERILKFLSQYQYSLKNLPLGDNPVEDFLFVKKSGNCEYFATAMALMLRIKGIPSRVVGGFKGGSYNYFGGYYIVRASDAHLWVEAWVNGRWLRLDPSGRVVRTSESVVFNFLDYIWNNLILDYDLKTQIKLAKSIKIPKFNWNRYILIFAATLVLISFIIIKLYKWFKFKRDPLVKFVSLMKKQGFKREKNQGLEEFLEKIEDPKLKQKALVFIKSYEEIYFKDKNFTKEDLRRLNKIIEEINESFKSR